MRKHAGKLDLLFLSQYPLWPQDQGYRIHGSQMALAAARLGVRVGVACMEPTPAQAPAPLRALMIPWPVGSDDDVTEFNRGWSGPGQWLRRKIAGHQGLDRRAMAGAVAPVKQHRPTAVIGVGMHSVMMLRGLEHMPGVRTAWYAADELVYFNVSCMRRDPVAALPARLRALALHAAIENAFARGSDAAIAVSPLDAKLLRWIAGVRDTVMIRNGVDLDYFAPTDAPRDRHSLAFWGRLDFEPNIDAACWFARFVWPALLERQPQAVWHIVGKNPDKRVMELGRVVGIRVHGEVADIREAVGRTGAAVLPMRCGGGIKNKLLEAAAMGMPIVASRRAVAGLDYDRVEPPFEVCAKPQAWVAAIARLWDEPAEARAMGRRARAWVESCHSWDGAARELIRWLDIEAAADHEIRRAA